VRDEREMMRLILGFARNDERIRAVLIEGSRADPSAPKDKHQDYDINYFVTETRSFIDDKSWILNFGKPLIIQEPDWNDNATGLFGGGNHDFDRHYAYMVIFNDGIRIDFGLKPINNTELMQKNNEPVIVLLDKDNILPQYPVPSDRVYWIKKPNQDMFHGYCNEFWWLLNNVAKSIMRDELPYVIGMHSREMLDKMVEWYIGTQTDFSVSAGKMGKYFKRYLSPELYAQYAATYSGSEYDDIWKAIYIMCDLFHTLALSVASYFGFTYRQDEEDGIREYLRMVREDEC